MTARHVTGSTVSKTEAKLIIALKKELQVASILIEKDKIQKTKLVEIARALRNECLKMQAERGLPSQVILKVSDECQTDLPNEPERISMVEQSA